ncbi:hypothetical protein NQ318_009301 [Aromia moschata]|uniref:Uncharacterized protein n=1 Tax=Aromia moschata TaxID=1265417 RepID=A0AAV8YIJ2_9CUCU|nr:hypothetical protein NQ318_009301 [Aromia moschata]
MLRSELDQCYKEIMISSTTPLLFLLTLSLLSIQTRALETPGDVLTLKKLLTKRDASRLLCCLVQDCQEIPLDAENHNAYQCYKREVCGEKCHNENNWRTGLPYTPRTPGYKIKQNVVKKFCQGNQCVNYRFQCERCPDPEELSFSIYGLRSDCLDCYY